MTMKSSDYIIKILYILRFLPDQLGPVVIIIYGLDIIYYNIRNFNY